MEPRVVAIIVAHEDGEHLARTLRALAAQTRTPDLIVKVDNGSEPGVAGALSSIAGTTLSLASELSFGEAVRRAVDTLDDAGDGGFFWLLAQDSDPAPDALARLLGALEVSPSVAIVGPKQMDWDRGDYIREFGQTITGWGRTVSLVDDELDQAQHDSRSDVMAVGANGMLVREHVWRHLGGFDQGLSVADDALDFCIRTRLAGHRVEVVPNARVRTAGDGVIGPDGGDDYRASVRRARQVRTAALYRRLAYTRGLGVLWHWLGLLPNALWRIIGLLLGKRPTAVGPEIGATLAVMFDGLSLRRSRKNLKRTRTAPWSSLDALRMPFAEVRRRNALAREALRIRLHGHHVPIYFFASGGAWVTLALTLVSLVVMSPLIGSSAISGGALLPLATDVPSAWSQVMFGWREGALGTLAPADPFSYIAALLATLTWWDPTFSLVVLWFIAIPAAGLGAWMFASRLSPRPVIRAFVGVGYGLAPTLLVALSDGRPTAVIAHILLPWLAYAALRAVRSWAASATAALLFAAVIACAPSLGPVLILVWIGAVSLTGRYVARFLAIPLPALALFAPIAVWQIFAGNPVALLADPGATVTARLAPHWQLALGFPARGLGGWIDLTGSAPGTLNTVTVIVVIVLVALLAAMAVAGLFSPTPIRAQLALLVALLGLISAIAAASISVAFVGSIPVPLWPGSALSVMWLALLVAAASGMSVLRRFSIYPAVAGLLAVTVLALPMAVGLVRGTEIVAPSNGQTLPAYVVARAHTDPQLGTLILTAQPNGGLAATLERNLGATLNNSSTALSTATNVDSGGRELATVVANLSSLSGNDSRRALTDLGIGSVLLTPAAFAPGSSVTTQATEMTARAMVALDANPSLESVGKTDFGLLWRFATPDTEHSAGLTPASATQPWRAIILAGQLLVLLLTLLLAIPTGIPQADIRPRRNLAGLNSEPIAFEPKDSLAGGDDEQE